MPIQTIVNKELPIGVPGEFYDNSPRRVHGYIVSAEGGIQYPNATGSITLTANPSDGDTVTLGNNVYTFRTTPAAIYDVAIGASAEETGENLYNAINGTKSGFYEGTPANAQVRAVSFGSSIAVEALDGGEAGNIIDLAANGAGLSVSGATLTGGSTVAVGSATPLVARAYTLVEEGKVQMGGNGIFAGIAVSPKEYALRGGLTPSMALTSGSAVSIADMGHIIVQVREAVTIGQACYFDPQTGELSGGTANGGGAGVEIKGSKFVFYNAEAGGLAVLELTGFGAV